MVVLRSSSGPLINDIAGLDSIGEGVLSANIMEDRSFDGPPLVLPWSSN